MGKDQPIALFSYLALITSVAMAVAAHVRIEKDRPPENSGAFRVAPWVAVTGTFVIFAGWYGKYFDISDRRGTGRDLPPEALTGPYLALAARTAPLVFVFVTVFEW